MNNKANNFDNLVEVLINKSISIYNRLIDYIYKQMKNSIKNNLINLIIKLFLN